MKEDVQTWRRAVAGEQIYGQAFVIYALAEFHAATGDADSLAQARRLFYLVGRNSWNPQSGGYWEAFSRGWGMVDDLRLSDRDFNSPLTMNTLANGLNPAGGVVGFLNAWQPSGDPQFLRAARAVWDYIDRFIVDREHGDWIAGRTPDGAPLDRGKVDPWKASYHNSRACFEVMERLQGSSRQPAVGN